MQREAFLELSLTKSRHLREIRTAMNSFFGLGLIPGGRLRVNLLP